MKLSDLLTDLGAVEEADGWVAHCPAHGDSKPSLRIAVGDSGKLLLKDRAGCDYADVLAALNLTHEDVADMEMDAAFTTLPPTTARPSVLDVARLTQTIDRYIDAIKTPAASVAREYASKRFGTDNEAIIRLGLGFATDLSGGPRLVVPFKTPQGEPAGYQARALNSAAQVRWLGPTNPHGATWSRLGYFDGGSGWPEVIITEGPGDALTAAAAGYNAIAIRGAALATSTTLVDELVAWLDGKDAVIAGDGDAAGSKFSRELERSLGAAGVNVKVLPIPNGHDLTSLRETNPAAFHKMLTSMVSGSAATSTWDIEQYPLDDLNVARFARDYLKDQGRPIKYTAATGFLVYSQGIWESMDALEMRTEVHKVVDMLASKRQGILARVWDTTEGDDKARSRAKENAARKIERYGVTPGIDAILTELRSVQGVRANIDAFDAHKSLMCAKNGVIDLATGELRPHDPTLLLTKRVEIDYNPDAPAHRWAQFLEEIFPGQPEMPGYLQRMIGYGITGHTTEQIFCILYGTGANGKSLFTNVLERTFDAFTKTVPFSTFEAKPTGGPSPEVARLMGARLALASEGDQGKQMAEALLKRITGGDRMVARHMYKNAFEFTPEFLMLMSTNYRPSFKGQDEGLWRRVKLIDFKKRFSGAERDPDLESKLLKEQPGILAWAVKGAILWHAQGLGEPANITQVVTEYRQQTDVLNGFLPGVYTHKADEWIPRTKLFQDFQEYAEVHNFRDLAAWSSRAFYGALQERGFRLAKRNGVYGFIGIAKGSGEEPDESTGLDAIIESTEPAQPTTIALGDFLA